MKGNMHVVVRGKEQYISEWCGRATVFAVLFLWCSLVQKMLYCAITGLFSENSFSIDHWGSWFMFFRLLYQANQIQTMTAVQSRISHNWNPIICLFNLYLMFDSGNIDCNIQVVWICMVSYDRNISNVKIISDQHNIQTMKNFQFRYIGTGNEGPLTKFI